MCHCKSELADFNKAYSSYELQKCATIFAFFSAYSWFHSWFDLSGDLPIQSVKFRSLDCQLNYAGFFFAGLIELHEVDILEIRFCLWWLTCPDRRCCSGQGNLWSCEETQRLPSFCFWMGKVCHLIPFEMSKCGKVWKMVVLIGLFDCGFQIYLSSEAVPKLESDISSVTWPKGKGVKFATTWFTFCSCRIVESKFQPSHLLNWQSNLKYSIIDQLSFPLLTPVINLDECIVTSHDITPLNGLREM